MPKTEEDCSMFHPFPENVTEDFIPRLEALLDRQRRTIRHLGRHAEASYDALLKPIQDLDEELDRFFTPLAHLNSVANSEQTQQAYTQALPLLTRFESERIHDAELFGKLESIPPQKDPDRHAVWEHTVRDFVLSGARLDAEGKKRIEEIDVALSEWSNTFSQNLLEATDRYELIVEDPADVAELPPNDREAARIERDGKTVYRFTLQAPSFLSYMTYGSNRALRAELHAAYNTRAPENGDVIDTLLQLRDEKARLLGFDHYADYALQRRDAQSPEAVMTFLESLLEATLPHARKELETLRAFAKEQDGIEDLGVHDLAYYSEKLKKRLYDFDESLTRPYFEQEQVLTGLLSLVSELFDVTFEPTRTPTWDPSVRVYDLYENGTVSGRIYFDLEARPHKRSGAWMHDWESYFVDTQGDKHFPSVFVVANFAAANETTPSLLRHDDVVTLFHEMGHALHHLFGRSHERAVSGIHGVAWDTVEFPSQFLENFAYEAPILRRIGRHYQTGETIPDALIKTVRRSKNFQAALGMLRQIEFALFDFLLHQGRYQGEAIQELLDRIRRKTALIMPPDSYRFQHGFSHIFAGGYAAGYYSYKWAEVLSADAFFACVDADGRFDPERARTYRTEVLARGGSRPMHRLFEAWLGRPPEVSGLLRLYDLTPPEES
jgi:oligopeptidase A